MDQIDTITIFTLSVQSMQIKCLRWQKGDDATISWSPGRYESQQGRMLRISTTGFQQAFF
jgi:hypothetical protein